ncbi:MAG: ABC transporter ATP-binding protein [Phycisphaerales bacterium]|nr:ABC transporter ATP-binding protein [Phycisphaerales bacterium]
MNAVELENIRVVYNTKKTGDRVALDSFSLTANNEMIALLGPNGSGKSTLLNVIAQTITPGSGQLIAPTSRKALSIVFQTPALDLLLTVRENLMVAGALHDLPKVEIQARIVSIVQELGLEDRLNDQVRHLSGGLARRADLARALIAHPSVLLLDEPTTGLDIDARRIFWETLDRTRDRLQMTVLMATHITDEAEHSDRVVMMRDGQTVKDDSPAQLKSTLGDRIIRITCQHESEIATISQWLDSNSIEHITCNRLILGHHADSSLAASCPVDSASITIAPPTLDDVYTYYAQAPVLTESTGVRS